MRAPHLPPADAAKRVKAGEAILLDVREAMELDMAAVPGALHVPMGEVPARTAEIPRDRPVLVLCHHGMRSQAVADWLLRQGYAQVWNVRGGIAAWADEVDASVGRY